MTRHEPRLPPPAPGAGEDEIWLRTAAFAIRKMRMTPGSVRPSLDYAQAALAALAPLRQAERERARAGAIEEAAREAERWRPIHTGANVIARAIRTLAPAPAAEPEPDDA